MRIRIAYSILFEYSYLFLFYALTKNQIILPIIHFFLHFITLCDDLNKKSKSLYYKLWIEKSCRQSNFLRKLLDKSFDYLYNLYKTNG